MGSPDSLGSHKPILILFDGVCNLCNGLVQFIIRRDPKGCHQSFNFSVIFAAPIKPSQMKAYVFPGQGAQFTGMGKDIFDRDPRAAACSEKLTISWALS